MNLPNGIKLGLYLSGLAALGYLAYSLTGDPIMTICIMLIARWIKPYFTVA